MHLISQSRISPSSCKYILLSDSLIPSFYYELSKFSNKTRTLPAFAESLLTERNLLLTPLQAARQHEPDRHLQQEVHHHRPALGLHPPPLRHGVRPDAVRRWDGVPASGGR